MLETHTYKEVETMTGITERILIRGKIQLWFWCKDCIYLKEVYRCLIESILMQPFRIVDE
ncbi:hypothetical protein [Bacillus cereus group sp. MG9]|uniref:hypothetical protein n=1 Tax=Bacillus cereus group sp. MG9 TaxID=3040247 RepID=UPI003396543D